MKRKKRKNSSPMRRRSKVAAVVLSAVALVYAGIADWYSHHSPEWLAEVDASWPRLITAPLLYVGDRVGMVTDAFGWTGHDAVYDFDEPAPEGQVFFAGAPRRVGPPAPDDIQVLDRGEFVIGYSPRLRHPVWVAYHVPPEARFEHGKRPAFHKDGEVSSSPMAGDYARTGYDRGHMAPNYAIETRFGKDVQKRTFAMTNVSPQSPSLNRGPWRELEHRIADLWTAKYGEIWVVVGAVSPASGSHKTLPGTSVEVPESYYMVVAAQTADGVRALAVLLPQKIGYGAFPVHNIVTIDRLEELTGLDFFPEMPTFLQDALEADLPTRLWPVRFFDALKLVGIRSPGGSW